MKKIKITIQRNRFLHESFQLNNIRSERDRTIVSRTASRKYISVTKTLLGAFTDDRSQPTFHLGRPCIVENNHSSKEEEKKVIEEKEKKKENKPSGRKEGTNEGKKNRPRSVEGGSEPTFRQLYSWYTRSIYVYVSWPRRDETTYLGILFSTKMNFVVRVLSKYESRLFETPSTCRPIIAT